MSDVVLSVTRGQVGRMVDSGCFIQGADSLAPFMLGLFAGTIGAFVGVAALVVMFFV
jgi:hypothetical protein